MLIKGLSFMFSFLEEPKEINIIVKYRQKSPNRCLSASKSLNVQQIKQSINKNEWISNTILSINSFKLAFRQCSKQPSNAEEIRKQILIDSAAMLSNNYRFLTKVSINNANLSDDSISVLLKGEFKFIVVLDLQQNKLTSQGVTKLVEYKNFKYLKQLSLKKNTIGNKGIKQLSLATWPRLLTLDISSINSTTNGLTYFFKHTLPQLKIVNYSYNTVKLTCLRTILQLQMERILLEYSFITTADGEGILCQDLNELVFVNKMVKEEDFEQLVDDDNLREELISIYRRKVQL